MCVIKNYPPARRNDRHLPILVHFEKLRKQILSKWLGSCSLFKLQLSSDRLIISHVFRASAQIVFDEPEFYLM